MIDTDGWVNLEEWTGRSIRRLPLNIREKDEPLTHCSSIVAATGDEWCDPRSGGIANVKTMAQIYGVRKQQFLRNILLNLDYVRWLGNLPVTNVNSARTDAARHRENVTQTWRNNLLGSVTDPSSGSGAIG